MKFYVLLGRWISSFFVFFLTLHGRIAKRPRVRVIVCSEEGEILLVRNWVGPQQWEFPGGVVERNETPQQAAQRELFEEVGIKVDLVSLQYVKTLYGRYEAPIYQVVVLRRQVPVRLHNPKEITAINWCDPRALPRDTSRLTQLALRSLSKTK